MASHSTYLTYRPLTIGWCIKKDDFSSLRKSFQINFTLWGGVFNPFIVVDDANVSKSLLETFKPDILFTVSENPEVQKFIEGYPHLQTSRLKNSIIAEEMPSVLDITHPISLVWERNNKSYLKDNFKIPKWAKDDPLSDVLAMSVGQYPIESPFKIDFEEHIIKNELADVFTSISIEDPIPSESLSCLNPYEMSRLFISEYPKTEREIGAFLGDKNCFQDLVDFWNLRASGKELIFVDLVFKERFAEWIKFQFKKRNENQNPRGFRNEFALVSSSLEAHKDFASFFNKESESSQFLIKNISQYSWSALNFSPTHKYIKKQTVLGNIDKKHGKPTLSFELKDKPYIEDIHYRHQRLAVDVRLGFYEDENNEFTFGSIYCPQMNHFYEKEISGLSYDNNIRSKPDGFSIIIDCYDSHLNIGAIKIDSMLFELFKVHDLKIAPSKPGLIAKQIQKQLGGLRKCKVFKIEGVRNLLNKFKSIEWFNYDSAYSIIGDQDPETSRPRFEKYENLWLEYRNGRTKQKPADIFKFLVRNKILRPGLETICANCQLLFWKPIDEIRAMMLCSYCGNQQDISDNLHEKKWSYKRSGLFESDDQQQGAVPVLVSMHQLNKCLENKDAFFSFALNVEGTDSKKCESDFLCVSKFFSFTKNTMVPQIVVSECKNKGLITRADLENLTSVIKKFPQEKFDTYILLAKFSDFTSEEIMMIKEFENPYFPNIIMWSARELEPYDVYERIVDKFDFDGQDYTLEGLARATHYSYLEPRFKSICN